MTISKTYFFKSKKTTLVDTNPTFKRRKLFLSPKLGRSQRENQRKINHLAREFVKPVTIDAPAKEKHSLLCTR